jgi:hypothetical protein
MQVLWSGQSELEELNKEIAGAQVVERPSNTVYIFKLHRPTCAYANVVLFSVTESIPDILLYVNEVKAGQRQL